MANRTDYAKAIMLAAAFFILITLLSPGTVLAESIISLEKNTFMPEETVLIIINNATESISMSIGSDEDVFRFLGDMKENIEFLPRGEGTYRIIINDIISGEIIEEQSFTVSRNHVSNKPQTLSLEKKEYRLGEIVRITLNGTMNKEELELSIVSEKESFKALIIENPEITFIPPATGNYKVHLKDNFLAIASAEFNVSDSNSTSPPPIEQYLEITTQNTTNPASGNNTTSPGINNQTTAPKTAEEITTSSDNAITLMPDQGFEPEETMIGEQVSLEPAFNLSIKDKKGIAEKISARIIRHNVREYDIELYPQKAGIKKILFRNISNTTENSFDLDEINVKRESFKDHFSEKRMIRSFYIDTSGVNYTDGTISIKASGSELWKCAAWNASLELCLGQWQKVMDLIPGQDYDIAINPEDPAYAETGVASINTKKPIYHPNETAEMIVVVLDIWGRLTSGADVTIAIQSPDATITTLTTANDDIKETQKGIYETSYNKTGDEGNYTMAVTAYAANVNSTMQSNFEVKSFYEFDIIRDTPVTIDPWQGPFQSAITIEPFVNITSYDFTEILPSEFLVTNAGGAEQRTTGNNTFLTWTNLSGKTSVQYDAQVPLITPNLYSLGKSFITYIDGVMKVFTESRFWHMAIDPIISLFFEDFESNWGCIRTANGSRPAAGDNCSRTPWGGFNGCSMPSAHRFCTTPDGQEGTHSTYAIQMTNFLTWDYTRGIFYKFDASPYDDVIVSGAMAAASLDNNAEFCRIWVVDNDSWSTIYECVNNVPAGCEAGDTTPEAADYRAFSGNLTSEAGISIDGNVSIYLGANHSGTINDYCFWDRINITGYAIAPNVTNLTYPANRSTINISTIQFNYTVNATKDLKLPNCTLWTNFNGSWAANKTDYDVRKEFVTNITVTVPDGTYLWNVQCYTRAGLSDFHDYNYTITVDAQVPVKTIVRIDDDFQAPWNTTNRNPYINISLNKNASCRLSTRNVSYAMMSNETNCTLNGTRTANCTYIGNPLPIGANDLFIACNDTSGHADTNDTSLYIQLDVLCDSHNDCLDTQYCDFMQHCHLDELAGYPCDIQGYEPLTRHEVCGNGTNSYCANDSTFSFTGWYCTGSATDCVYNDQGKSYLLGETLCISGTNNYKNCSISNSWDAQFNCSNQFDPMQQTAVTHPLEYCAYFSSAQTCANGTNGGCQGMPDQCSPYIYNQTTLTCGTLLKDCDVGCLAQCDSSNSTAPGITNSICYYNKACSNACAWSESSTEAPEYCINDNNGGICAYTARTNPNASESCYWQPSCNDVTGVTQTMGAANNLKADYCDYCNTTGNQSGSYSPAPNASCYSDCANSGTLYYDSGLTPADRNDDCNNGSTTILTDSLTIGDIWDGSGPASCNNTECNLDCQPMFGQCNAGACICTDIDNPILQILDPQNNTWTNNPRVNFTYNVTDISSGIQNCSLLINSNVNLTNSSVNQSNAIQSFLQDFTNSTINWSIICIDNSTNNNQNQSENRTIGIDTTIPILGNANINGTQFQVNRAICLNISANDTYSGINRVYALINLPIGGTEEVDLYDNSTTSCDGGNGNGIYSAEYTLIFGGTYEWTNAYAIDKAMNQNTTSPNLEWNVTAGGTLNATMNNPGANIRINESEFNNNYLQNCTATCQYNGTNCKDVFMFPQHYVNGGWERMDFSTGLFPDSLNYSCGNLSSLGSASWWNSSWQYRKRISIKNNNNTNSLPANYSLKIIVNTTGSTMLDDGSDIRIAYWNGTNNTEIDRINTTAFNTSSTELWFKIQKEIAAGAADTSYYIYYGNPGAGAAPQNKTRVYDFWDDLSEGLSQWTIDSENTDAVSISSGAGNPAPSLRHDPDSTQTKNAYYDTRLQTADYRFQNGIIEYDIYLSGTARSIHQFGFRVPNLNFTNGYSWRLQSSSNDGGWLEFTGRATWSGFGTSYNATTTGTWHHVVLNISGANYNATVDGGSVYSGTDSTKLDADYLISHVHATGTDYYILIDNIQARKTISPAPSASLQEEESPPLNNYSCSHAFSITSQPDEGNNTYPIRCEAISSNSPTDFSASRNITINNHPFASIQYPENNIWVTKTININGSTSYDTDGSLTGYAFYYDNNTNFDSPTIICSSASSNCTWNTTAQNQCINNSLSCYLRLNVTDNDGLGNFTIITVGFDTQGPLTTINNPASFENITTNSYSMNASAIDGEIGTIRLVLFEYRENATTTWKSACNDSDMSDPFNCSWDLTAITDGKNYEVRSYALDYFNNTGDSDTKNNITIDKNGPTISLESPGNNSYHQENVTFSFNATDAISPITSCTLIIDEIPNQSISNPVQGSTINFSINYSSEGQHSWKVSCIDALGNANTSETRTFNIDMTGPLTTLENPTVAALMYGSYKVNASATDSSVGNISIVSFEYRENSTAEWILICNSTAGPDFNCLWNTTNVTDGTTYEVRAFAVDALNNTGSPSTRIALTIDNNGPTFLMLAPSDNSLNTQGNITFTYIVDDASSGISNCSLIINGSINQTNSSVPEGTASYFTLNNQNSTTLNWSIICWDDFSPEKHSTETPSRILTVLILYILNDRVSTDKEAYELGNQLADTANITTAAYDFGNNSIDAAIITDIILTANESRNIWWNTSYKFRMRTTINETLNVTRNNQWMHTSFLLDENCSNLAHKNSLRLVQEIGPELDFNQWNITYCADANFIKSLWISYRLNLTALSGTNMYIYYDNQTSFTKKSIDRGPMRLVWVNTAGSGNAPSSITIKSDLNTSLTASGYASTEFYDELSTSATLDDVTLGVLQNYSIVYFDSGAKYSRAWSTAEATALWQYVNQSGNLFLTGQELGYQASTDGWIYNAAFSNLTRVSAGYVDNANPTTFTVAANHPATQYIGSIGARVSVTGDYEDGYTTLAGAGSVRIINWTGSATPTGGTANDGMFDPSCTGFCGKTVHYSGLFYISATQGIQNTTARADFLRGSVEWFMNNSIAESKGGLEQWIARNTTGSTGPLGNWSWIFNVINLKPAKYRAISLASKQQYNNATASDDFNVTLDKTSPKVTLIAPPPNSTSNSTVTFSYRVNDTLSTVENCSLIIDGVLQDTHYIIQEGTIEYFYPRIPAGGWHNWSMNCTDYYNNVGASEQWPIYIQPPDLIITQGNITISNNSPRQGDNITINATIYNIGGSNAENITAQIYLGDPELGGIQIGVNFTFNLTDITGDNNKTSINATWTVTGPGPFNFFIIIDPPTSLNGSIFELNESNNKANITLHVPGYQTFYGKVKNNIYLATSNNLSLYIYQNITNVSGNIFVTDTSGTVSFSQLQAIGRNINNDSVADDFNETDNALNMTNFNDSIRITYTGNTDLPLNAKNFTIFGRDIKNVAYINSTNSSTFITGIFWDTSKGNTQYNGSQDLVFVTEIKFNLSGMYGQYDYEAKVPVNLKDYKAAGNSLAFYWEIL